MKLAAIDIGSNAVRLQISQVIDVGSRPQFKSLEFIRLPLALGKEVFTTQSISPQGIENLKKVLQAFKLLIELYQVDEYRVCATCFLREAQNKATVKTMIQEELGLEIHIINAEEEADLINQALQAHINLDQYMHIDVGGGSTEISFYRQSAPLASRSFQLGSLRDNTTPTAQETWEEMKNWIEKYKQAYVDRLWGIATGGNINKLAQLASTKANKITSLKRLVTIQRCLASYNLEERMERFYLNADRAALILPAAEIYLNALKWAGIKHILVPQVSLRHGIIQALYQKRQSAEKPLIAT